MSSATTPVDRQVVTLLMGPWNRKPVLVSVERMKLPLEYLVFSLRGVAKKTYYLRMGRIAIEVHPPAWEAIAGPMEAP